MKYILLTLCSIFLLSSHTTPVQAAKSITMPVRATLVQCGKRADIQKSCERDTRCCALLQPHERQTKISDTNNNKT